MSNKKVHISEMFSSFQGEGLYTGKNSIWIRMFMCNLQCDGFGQDDPTNTDTYQLPYKTFDVANITKIEDLPVWDFGCDSSYTWAKKYKHLVKQYSPSEVCDELEKLMSGTDGKFIKQEYSMIHTNRHLCITGGEPLLKKAQLNFIDIYDELIKRNNAPLNVTFETNATQLLTPKFSDYISDNYATIHASCSPKLFTVSGEQNSKAWNFQAIHQYHRVFDELSLKFVMTNEDRAWDELDLYLSQIQFPKMNVYIMPVGATKEQQSETQISAIADRALDRGFNVSGRLHCYMYGNQIGT